jgi:hypothetical protein
MTTSIAGLLLIAYFLLCIEIYLATYAIGEFRLSFGVFGPTELRVLLAIGNLRLLIKPDVNLAGKTFLLYDVGAVVAIIGMTLMAVFSTIRNTNRLYNEERLP